MNEDIKQRIKNLEDERKNLIEGQDDYKIDSLSAEIEDLEDELEMLEG